MFEYAWIKPLVKPALLILGGEILAILIVLFFYFAVGGEKPAE